MTKRRENEFKIDTVNGWELLAIEVALDRTLKEWRKDTSVEKHVQDHLFDLIQKVRSAKPAKCEFVTGPEFDAIHGKKPAYRGLWRFDIYCVGNPAAHFYHNGTFTEAKRAALAQAKRVGAYRVRAD